MNYHEALEMDYDEWLELYVETYPEDFYPEYYFCPAPQEGLLDVHYRIDGPNGPAYFVRGEGEDFGIEKTTVYDVMMEAMNENLEWVEREDTPFPRWE